MSIFSWFFTLGVLNSWVDGWGLLVRTKSQIEFFWAASLRKWNVWDLGWPIHTLFWTSLSFFLGFVNNVSCHIFCTSHHWVPLLHRHHIRLVVSCLLSFGGVVVTFHLESGAKSNQVLSEVQSIMAMFGWIMTQTLATIATFIILINNLGHGCSVLIRPSRKIIKNRFSLIQCTYKMILLQKKI